MTALLRPGPTALPVHHVEHCMGTVFSFRVPSPGVSRAALDDAVAWLHEMDALFSTYRPDSELSRINDGSLRVARASTEVRHVLAACEAVEAATGGWFSPRPDGRALDLDGYVKGWVTQRVADLFAAAGSPHHCVNGGGDVVCAGRPEAGRGWSIGIADPHHRGGLLTVIEAEGPVAVATSGTAERGTHILDPHDGSAATGLASATVVATDLVTADTWATAAVAMGPDEARTRLGRLPGVAALLVTPDGSRTTVGAWPERTTHEERTT